MHFLPFFLHLIQRSIYMTDINTLENYFKNEISPTLGSFRAIMNISKYIIIITLIGFANFFIGIGGDVGLIFTGVFVFFCFLLMFFSTKQIKLLYRNKIIMPLIKQLEDEDTHFDFNGSIDTQEIRQSKLFDFGDNHTLTQSKLLTCKEKDRNIEMLNVKMTNTYRTSDNESTTVTTEGLFVVAPTKIKIEGTTLLAPDIAERVAGYIGQLTQNKTLGDLHLIRLDSPDFEKEFIVYGDDEVTAHYILNHTVMEVLSEVGKKFLFQFQISFVMNRMYLFFPFATGWLEAEVEINKKQEEMLSFDVLKRDFEVIYAAIDTVNRIEKHHLS